MNLHNTSDKFDELAIFAHQWLGISIADIKRDYYIVLMLQNLAKSQYAQECVFKGGTSLSKCYPGSIERFSEDIDLTFVPKEPLSFNQYDKRLKDIERIMTAGGVLTKLPGSRNNRNKASYVRFGGGDVEKIKLEIASTILPEPCEVRTLKSYIQEYLESEREFDLVQKYGLESVSINTLRIERTFLDKVMAVKRHAIGGKLVPRVRHVYDVTRLFERDDIQKFLADKEELKRIVRLTKDTDGFYLTKRDIPVEYNPVGPYDFPSWRRRFNEEVRVVYEDLHNHMLYFHKKQDFDKAVEVFQKISDLFAEIGE